MVFDARPLKGAVDVEDLTTSLKRCPDTKPELFSGPGPRRAVGFSLRKEPQRSSGRRTLLQSNEAVFPIFFYRGS
jgi:hypothetical protein